MADSDDNESITSDDTAAFQRVYNFFSPNTEANLPKRVE
jgi:hypothetical protein